MKIPMFDGSVAQWNVDKISLMNWMRFYYHRILTLSEEESPPDRLEEYDLLLDDWLDNKDAQEKADRKKQSKQSGHEHQGFQMA